MGNGNITYWAIGTSHMFTMGILCVFTLDPLHVCTLGTSHMWALALNTCGHWLTHMRPPQLEGSRNVDSLSSPGTPAHRDPPCSHKRTSAQQRSPSSPVTGAAATEHQDRWEAPVSRTDAASTLALGDGTGLEYGPQGQAGMLCP